MSGSPSTSPGSRPANLLQPGEVLAGYQIESLLGKGGMGEVYLVRQLSLDRVVALKVLAPRMVTRDPTFADRFFAEARAAGKLNHPNIIKVHDVGSAPLHTADGGMAHYFSMEYIDGESLQTVLDREGALPEARIAAIMRGMAAAVGYAAQVGLVHRDIKPDNIMLTGQGEVKLADLGLATASQDEQTHVAERDEQGRIRVMGTPLYMSPEQARGLPLDHRSDQYSVGATLFHLITGHPPFQGADTRTVMKMHVAAPIPDPADERTDIDDAWCELCVRLLGKTPDSRFLTPDKLIAAVDAACAGIPVSVLEARSGKREATAKPGMPSWVWWVVGVLAAGVLVAGLIYAGSRPRRVPAPAEGTVPAQEASPPAPVATKPPAPTEVKPPVVPPAVVIPPVKPPPPPQVVDPDVVLWGKLRTDVATLRAGYHYLEAKALFRAAATASVAPERQAAAKTLAGLVDDLVTGESAIRAFLKAKIITLQIPGKEGTTPQVFRELTASEAVLVPDDGIENRIPRSKLRIPWKDLLTQALADQGTSGVEATRITAVCLWFWREPGAASIVAKLPDPAIVQATKLLDTGP